MDDKNDQTRADFDDSSDTAATEDTIGAPEVAEVVADMVARDLEWC